MKANALISRCCFYGALVAFALSGVYHDERATAAWQFLMLGAIWFRLGEKE